MKGLDGGRLNIAACSLGRAQAALDRTLAYMSQRKAFGSSIDQFQALQFRLADMATQLEAARALLHKAARKLDAKDPEATRYIAMAKRFAPDVGFHVADESAAAPRGLRLSRGLRNRKDCSRPSGASNS